MSQPTPYQALQKLSFRKMVEETSREPVDVLRRQRVVLVGHWVVVDPLVLAEPDEEADREEDAGVPVDEDHDEDDHLERGLTFLSKFTNLENSESIWRICPSFSSVEKLFHSISSGGENLHIYLIVGQVEKIDIQGLILAEIPFIGWPEYPI